MDYLRLSHDQIHTLIQSARAGYPAEVCGLIGGQANTARLIVPVPNVAKNPLVNYQMAANSLLKALKTIDANGLELIGVYHSHPYSDPIPSPTDIQSAESHYPGLVQIIISLGHEQQRLKAWRIFPGQVDDVELLVGDAVSSEMPADHLSRAQQIAILLAALVSLVMMLSISISLLPPAPILTPVPR